MPWFPRSDNKDLKRNNHNDEASAALRLAILRVITRACFPEFSDQNPKFYPQLSIYSWVSFPKWRKVPSYDET
jgi:hypothetical protein